MSDNIKVDGILDAFRQRILDGEFGISGRLPSLRMLAVEYNTTHETMNKVVQRLQAEGILFSLDRAGVFVQRPRTRIPGITPRFDEYIRKQGQTPVEIDLEEPSTVPASVEVAKVFNIVENTLVVRRIRRQGTIYEHYRLAENFYPMELAGGTILEGMKQNVHFDVLAAMKRTHQKKVMRVHEDVIGRLSSTSEQKRLKLVRNTPVVEVLRVSYASNDNDSAIMFSRIVFVASYFILSYDYAPFWEND